ncbi:hypothetical protein QUA81_08990 [Microcoleus sp. F6_B4]
MVKYRHIFADVRLTGSRDTIDQTLHFLTAAGCKWETNGKYYPRGKLERAYYLHKFRGPLQESTDPTKAASPTPGEPQPRPWDAVLGGNNKPAG